MPQVHGFLLLGNTRSKEHDLHITSKFFLQKLSVSNHGRHNRCQVGYKLWIVDFHQVISTWAACGYDILHLVLCQKLRILSRHKSSSLGSLSHILESQAQQSPPHLTECLVF